MWEADPDVDLDCHVRHLALPKPGGERELCVIAGPTCDSFDVLYTERALPPAETGDLLIVPGMGAYTNASASTFNGFPLARLVAF